MRTETFIAERPGAIRQVLGSAIKFCRVAEGGADIYPRLSPTSEWDVAAGLAVVTAAGGKVTDRESFAAIRRGSRRFFVPEFIAWGDPAQLCSCNELRSIFDGRVFFDRVFNAAHSNILAKISISSGHVVSLAKSAGRAAKAADCLPVE